MKSHIIFWKWWGVVFIIVIIMFQVASGIGRGLYVDFQESVISRIDQKIAKINDSTDNLSNEQVLKIKAYEEEKEELTESLRDNNQLVFSFWFFIGSLVISGVTLWFNRLVVPQNFIYLFEWDGIKMEPFEPGRYFPFSWFGLLQPKGMIPTNIQTISVLSGERSGVPEDILKVYTYGSGSNIEPDTGDDFKALYKIEFKCSDPVKMAYAHDDVYNHVVGLVESKIRDFVGSKSGEKISDQFSSYNYKEDVLDKIPDDGGESLSDVINNLFGIKISNIIPMDVILTPQVQEYKRRLDESSRKKEIYIAETEAAEERKKLQAKNDEITKNTISVIKNTAGVNGNKALDYLVNQKKLETMEVVSKNGTNTFIDGAGGGNFAGGAGFGWGFNSQNKSKPNSEEKAEKKDEKKNEKLEVKPKKN